jgi:cold shock protein
MSISMVGTWKHRNTAKGYGFVKLDRSHESVFVHVRDLQAAGLADPVMGTRVAFEIRNDPRGPRAVNLQAVAGR